MPKIRGRLAGVFHERQSFCHLTHDHHCPHKKRHAYDKCQIDHSVLHFISRLGNHSLHHIYNYNLAWRSRQMRIWLRRAESKRQKRSKARFRHGIENQRWHGAISDFLLFSNIPFAAAPSQKFPINRIRTVPDAHRLFFLRFHAAVQILSR